MRKLLVVFLVAVFLLGLGTISQEANASVKSSDSNDSTVQIVVATPEKPSIEVASKRIYVGNILGIPTKGTTNR